MGHRQNLKKLFLISGHPTAMGRPLFFCFVSVPGYLLILNFQWSKFYAERWYPV